MRRKKKKMSKVIKFIKVSYLFAHVLCVCVVERASDRTKGRENKNIFNFPMVHNRYRWMYAKKKVRNKLISMTKTNAVQVKSIHANLFIYGVQWSVRRFFMNE